MDLADLVKGMISDVKTGKAKPLPRKKKKSLTEEKKLSPAAIQALLKFKTEGVPMPIQGAPFIDTAIVMIVNETTCKCGHQHTYPADSLFIKQTRVVRGIPEHYYHQIATPNIDAVYCDLPRTIERAEHNVAQCQDCFTANRPPFVPMQTNFSFAGEQEFLRSLN